MATLEKLEALLARVQQRRAEPRPARSSPPQSGVSSARVAEEAALPGAAALTGSATPPAPAVASLSESPAPVGELEELEELDDIEEYEDELEELSDDRQQAALPAAPTATLEPPVVPDEQQPLKAEGQLLLTPERSFEQLLDQALQLGE